MSKISENSQFVGFGIRFLVRFLDLLFLLFLTFLGLIIFFSATNLVTPEVLNFSAKYNQTIQEYAYQNPSSRNLYLGCSDLFTDSQDIRVCLDYQELNNISLLVFMFLVSIFWFLLFILPTKSKWQASLFKRLFKIKIINRNDPDRSLSWIQITTREAIYFLSLVFLSGLSTIAYFYNFSDLGILPYFSFFNFLLLLWFFIDSGLMALSKEKASLKDRLSDTRVVKFQKT